MAWTRDRSVALRRVLSRLDERFWPRVDMHGPVHDVLFTRCWLWIGARSTLSDGSPGYGEISSGGNVKRYVFHTHVISYLAGNGMSRIPTGRQVLHRCDVMNCVTYHHLFLGTVGDNSRDCAAKGRNYRSFKTIPSTAKLAVDAVIEIRRRRAAGERCVDLAEEFGVTRQTIRHIFKEITWRHLINHKGKLGASVEAIRARHEAGETIYQLASYYKVKPATIRNVCKGKTWKKIKN